MNEDLLEIIRDVHNFFIGKGLTLSVAESCTGGLVSHYMTTLPGASTFFQAGVVTYSNISKITILGLSSADIEKYGVVSDTAAREMAEKVRVLLRTDYGLAATGNLGPEALEGKEKGLVYIAVSASGRTVGKELRLTGDRAYNKEQAAFWALKLLLETAKGVGS
ncbi:MAG: CinA family protein [Nitrospirae bacterium]|nr:CinA family protein [Nitrospirota bacterium]